jgi:putative acetyltransferase
MITIRPEAPADLPGIYRVNELAFGSRSEADLVDALRAEADPFLSLVAVRDGEVVGHISFTPVTLESAGVVSSAIGLAPLSVLPDLQNQGIGSDLVRRGLDECRRLGEEVVVVLGHPTYYARFGFVPAASLGIRSEYPVPDEVFRVAELRPGALGGRQGLIRYHPAFARF